MKKELVALAVALAFMASPANAEDPYDLAWTRQLGTSGYDISHGVATDAAGNVFISGHTYGSLYGTNAGITDAFVAKYNVPEPATLALLLAGGLALCRRGPASARVNSGRDDNKNTGGQR